MADPSRNNSFLKVYAGGKANSDQTDVQIESSTFGGGSGGGPPVDSETKNYLDAKVETVSAQNDARFAQILARLDAMNPATWQQNAGVVFGGLFVGIGLVFGILAFASDRFDSGVNSMGRIAERLEAQEKIDGQQNERLDRIISTLEGIDAQPGDDQAIGQE